MERHMWDIRPRIKEYFQLQIKKREKLKSLWAVKLAPAVQSPAQARGPLPVARCV